MNDRMPIRDRTLVLRILVPGLETRLREKIKETETLATVDSFLDLDGVTCEPTTARSGTLWAFQCDGATYPAKLVNLPCPVEIHKTHDHAMYYKCADVAQMLIVYEDDMALDEASQEKTLPGFPSYHPSGLTPPMKRVVERRFAAREHKSLAPPRAAVAHVEAELADWMDALNTSSGNNTGKDDKIKRKKGVAPPAVTSAVQVLEEVEEEIVDYEPWMDDHGRQPMGVQLDADDALCSLHPEVWLRPHDIQTIRLEEQARIQDALAETERKLAARKTAKTNKQRDGDEPSSKKGIASIKNREVVDDVTMAATRMMTGDVDLIGDIMGDDDFFNELDLADDDMKFEDMNL